MKKIQFWALAFFAIILQSCSVNTETTYYKDSASSMQSNILMDKSMMGLMNMMNASDSTAKKAPDLKNLSTDWKSLYDIQKDGLITLNQDSVKVLKKMFMKLNKENGEILGISMKYDKLMPQEVTRLFTQSKQMKNIPLQNIANWDGKKLTIDTEKFNFGEILTEIEKKTEEKDFSKPKSKTDSIEAYGKQMANGMLGMMKMFNMNLTNTLKFQKPIKSIEGKHDFVKQIDNKTIQINVRTNDLMDADKKLKNKDKKIIITTE